MKLTVKDMDIATGGVQVIILNEKDASLLDLHHSDRLLVRKGLKKTVAILNIAESEKAVPPGKIGFFEEMIDSLKAKEGDSIEISLERKPASTSYIRKKLDGEELSYEEIYEIINDIVKNKLTPVELSSYISANYTKGMSTTEIVRLTKAMMATGSMLKLKGNLIADMHCIGGIAGNRTTMIVVPIIAAAGLIVPKTSSKAITSPSGTADTMAALCNVALTIPELKNIIKKVGAFIIWGGSVNLAPADDQIIRVEHELSIDAEGQMLASIMAKKLSVSATHLLMDIPVGPEAKVANAERAIHLKHHFETLSKILGISIKVIITDGSQPIGNGIGPALEARDCLWLLKNDPKAPADLREKSLDLAAELLEFTGKAKKGTGRSMATQILDSGKAYEMMIKIIKAQGGKEIAPEQLSLGTFMHTVKAAKSGIVKNVSNAAIIKIGRVAGAPLDMGSGVYLHKHKGDRVAKGDALFTIYSMGKEKFDYAIDTAKKFCGCEIR